MRTKRLILLVSCVCALVFYTRAEGWTHTTVPSPKAKGQAYYVSNPDGVLTPQTEQALNEQLHQLYKNTEVELAVVAVDKYEIGIYSAYDFALDLFNYWGIGGKNSNTGLLVFLARSSRDVQIITGDGIAGIMTDAKCGEILDNNLCYLSDNDFDQGILHICKEIENYLMQDENRSELLLGWAPENDSHILLLMIWGMAGFVIMIILALKAYKKLQAKPGQTQLEIQEQARGVQGCTGCLMLFFPIPLLFFYIYYRYAKKRVPTIPANCKNCGSPMTLMPAEAMTSLLTKEQLAEVKLGSYEFDQWHCPSCGADELLRHKGPAYSQYRECSACHAKAESKTRTEKLISATYTHGGEEMNYFTCQCCGAQRTQKVLIPKKEATILSGSSSSGGGRSGSWGGGFSSGGGAGRRF